MGNFNIQEEYTLEELTDLGLIDKEEAKEIVKKNSQINAVVIKVGSYEYDGNGQILVDCKKGNKCEWGIDGMHTNTFCKKCFQSYPANSL